MCSPVPCTLTKPRPNVRTKPGQIRFPQADSLHNRTTPTIVIAPEIRIANMRLLFIPNTYSALSRRANAISRLWHWLLNHQNILTNITAASDSLLQLVLLSRTAQSQAARSARLPVLHSRSASQSAMALHPAAESQPMLEQMESALLPHSVLGSVWPACSSRSCLSAFRPVQRQFEFHCFRYHSPHLSEPILHTPTLIPQTYRPAWSRRNAHSQERPE